MQFAEIQLKTSFFECSKLKKIIPQKLG